MTNKRTLIVCDVQPDVVRKLPRPRLFEDLIEVAVEAARRSSVPTSVVHTLLRFDEPGYAQVAPSHPRLGVLRRLGGKNPNIQWFRSEDLSLGTREDETVVPRTDFLPHSHQAPLMEALRCVIGEGDPAAASVAVVGYGPTVQALCHVLGDVLAVPNVQIIGECVADENEGRRAAFLEHGRLFDERVVSLADYLEEADLLREGVDPEGEGGSEAGAVAACRTQPPNKYVCDCGRGGHISLFMPYLLRDYGYTEWPTQFWYEIQSDALTHREYHCPLGRQLVDLCDEPRFSRTMRLFLSGRKHLDEKDLLLEIVPELLPPTFASIKAARAYADEIGTGIGDGEGDAQKLLWFIKAVNQNGGRAVRVTSDLTGEGPLGPDEQLQVHVPRPLLHEGKFKFHVKTYQHLLCRGAGADAVWEVRMHDLFYLAVASRPWSSEDLSDEAQITTMRTHRLYSDHELRRRWNLTENFHSQMQTLMQRAIEQGKLQAPPAGDGDEAGAAQFEINSADWMLDEDGRVYLIECNGIPVLYDPEAPGRQELVTKGLNLYDRQYREDPKNAVVNDSALLREALGLALTGKLPEGSLWNLVATIPAPVAVAGKEE